MNKKVIQNVTTIQEFICNFIIIMTIYYKKLVPRKIKWTNIDVCLYCRYCVYI